nr:LPXTG cell wall anchor domain-containing protein [Pimelobacter simplex]
MTYTLRSGDAGTSLRNTAEVTAQSPEGRTTSAADTVIYEVPPASGPTPAPAPAPGAVDGVAGGSGALPATGSAVSPGYVGAGLAALLGGLALAWYGRRQHRPRRRG